MILVSLSLWKKIIRKWGQSVALRAIWKKNSLHSKTEDRTLKVKASKKVLGAEKSELQATDNNSSSSSHGLHPLA